MTKITRHTVPSFLKKSQLHRQPVDTVLRPTFIWKLCYKLPNVVTFTFIQTFDKNFVFLLNGAILTGSVTRNFFQNSFLTVISKARNSVGYSLLSMQVRPTTVCDEHALHQHNSNKLQFFSQIFCKLYSTLKAEYHISKKYSHKNAYPSVV